MVQNSNGGEVSNPLNHGGGWRRGWSFTMVSREVCCSFWMVSSGFPVIISVQM